MSGVLNSWSLENIHGTSIFACRVDAWAEIPLCAKFFPTGSRLGSSLRFPYDVLSPFAAFLLSYLKVSEENFAMLVTRTPAEMHRVVQPNCTEKSFRRMVSKLLLAPKLFKLIVCYLTALVAFVLTPMPRGKFQRSYLEWCCNSFRVVPDNGRNFVETKLKFLARTLLR